MSNANTGQVSQESNVEVLGMAWSDLHHLRYLTKILGAVSLFIAATGFFAQPSLQAAASAVNVICIYLGAAPVLVGASLFLGRRLDPTFSRPYTARAGWLLLAIGAGLLTVGIAAARS